MRLLALRNMYIFYTIIIFFSAGTETQLWTEAFFCMLPGTIKHAALCDFKENVKPLGKNNDKIFWHGVCSAYVAYHAELPCTHEVPCF
uniref:Putative secreted protein n=1 Tax=Ixodes ricinus TaxID=34613 RepID=A0A6B0UFX3_IXORI